MVQMSREQKTPPWVAGLPGGAMPLADLFLDYIFNPLENVQNNKCVFQAEFKWQRTQNNEIQTQCGFAPSPERKSSAFIKLQCSQLWCRHSTHMGDREEVEWCLPEINSPECHTWIHTRRRQMLRDPVSTCIPGCPATRKWWGGRL